MEFYRPKLFFLGTLINRLLLTGPLAYSQTPLLTWEASSDATSYEYCVSIYDVGYLLRRMDR